MAEPAPLTNFTCEPDPENPGWLRWRNLFADRYNEATLGKLLVRVEGPDTCRTRLIPRHPMHTNAAGYVHGGITLGLADISLFAAMYVLRGVDAGGSMTVDLTCHFIGGGDMARPLDTVVEVLRDTGRLGFLRGLVVQDEDKVASFSGTIRKPAGRK